MKNYFKRVKKDYRHIIMLFLIVLSLALIPLCFKYAYLRLLESLKDLWNCFLFYISELFDLGLSGDLSIIKLTKQPFTLPFNIPSDWDTFSSLMGNYWKVFFSWNILKNYIGVIGNFVFYITKGLLIVVPIITTFLLILKFKKSKPNNNYGQDTKPLQKFKSFEKKVYVPTKKWIMNFIAFVKENKYYLTIIIWIWCFSFNFISIVIELLAFYLYFIASLKTYTLYIQFVKLLMDLSVVINFIPVFIWVLIVLFIFDKIRKNIAYQKLSHMELMNRGFINERPIVSMICGTMGKGKTTMATDIVLSQEIMFRNKAFEMILECDLKFPNFPWINLELTLKRLFKNHSLYNLATIKRYIKVRSNYFSSHQEEKYIFNYDFKRYGLSYNDGLKVVDIWEVIEEYSQLYFVYIIQSSLILSNYSIRTDNNILSLGNFPLWDTELFRKNPKFNNACCKHAHILDFDALRLGRSLIAENERANFFEFGVISITEIGKERGNNLENQTIKKNSDECNQKNDLFNSWLKMVRHSATIGNYPFVKVITDEQRPESWGADARDLCEIVRINDKSDMKLAMPFFIIEEMLISFLQSRFQSRYYNFRYEHGDMSLLVYLYKEIISCLSNYSKKIYNRFGYYKLQVGIESGTQDGEIKKSNYYLMVKKIYSKRFSTDCFSDFFNEKALRSAVGINDIPVFKTEKASFEELMEENSFFMNDLTKILKKEK